MTEDFPRFDGKDAFIQLTLEQQVAIGAAALEMVACHRLAQVATREGDPSLLHMAGVVGDICSMALSQAVHQAVPRDRFRDGDGRPCIPSRAGRFCRDCGCSEWEPCDGGCGWADESLCTSCVEKLTPDRDPAVDIEERVG